LASKLGFPTINIYTQSEDCGVFAVDHPEYGQGVAFVMPNLTEIHFLKSVEKSPEYLECKVLHKVNPPENGILDYFYKGLAHVENATSNN
jgi:hypothetical protein